MIVGIDKAHINTDSHLLFQLIGNQVEFNGS